METNKISTYIIYLNFDEKNHGNVGTRVALEGREEITNFILGNRTYSAVSSMVIF